MQKASSRLSCVMDFFPGTVVSVMRFFLLDLLPFLVCLRLWRHFKWVAIYLNFSPIGIARLDSIAFTLGSPLIRIIVLLLGKQFDKMLTKANKTKKKAKEKKTLWKLAKITGLRLTLESRFSLHWQTIDTICLVFPRFSSLLSRLFLSLPVPDPCRDNDNDNKESHSRWRFSFGFASLANNPFYLIIYSVAFASAADWRDGIKIT